MDNDTTARIRFEIDEASRRKAASAIASVKGDLKDLNSRSLSPLARQDIAESRASRGGGGNSLTRAGNTLFNLPDVGPSTTIARFLQLGGTVQDALELTGAGFAQLATAGGLATVAIAALGVAIVAFSKNNEKAAQGTRALIASQGDYYKVVREGGRAQVQAALEASRLEEESLRARIAENQRFFDAIEENDIAGIGRTIADALNINGAKELREETQKLEQQLLKASIDTGRYEAALDSALIKQNQFVADFTLLNETQAERTRERYQLEIDTAKEFYSINKENVGEFLEDLEVRRNALSAELHTLENRRAEFQAILDNSTDEAQRAVAAGFLARIQDLDDELVAIGSLFAASKFWKDLADAEKRAAEEAERLGQASDELNEAFKKRQDAEKELRDAQAEAAIAIEQAQQRVNEAVEQGERDRRRILADSDAELRDITEQFGIDQRDAAEDTNAELKRIRDDAALEQLDAIGDRDALALFQSKEAAQKEEREAKQQADKESRRRERDNQRRIEQLAQATQRELDILKERNDAAVQAARNALEIERTKQNMEIAERQKALDIAIEQYKNFNQILLDYARHLGQQVIIPNTVRITPEEAIQWGNPSAANSTELLRPQSSVATLSGASGGSNGGININIPISGVGLNRREIIRQVDERLAETLAQEGFQ